MTNDNLIERIKKIFQSRDPEKIFFECLNCGKKFDGFHVEDFIRHQIDNKHFEYEKHEK